MQHRQALLAMLRARCRGSDVAEPEDLLQELWLRCSGIDIAGIVDPRGYLFRAAHNLMINHSSQLARNRRRENVWDYDQNRATGGFEPPTAERGLLARELLEEVDRALDAVGARTAYIFRRYRIDGTPQVAIAEELGVSLSTVEKDLRKAYDAVIAVRDMAHDG